MSEALYPYYESELRFIRELAKEFAKQYPATANRLLLEADRSTDPHVERLIESFALLAGRIQHKIDDEFPELTDSLLSVLYPHYLAPIPSMAVLQFELDRGRGDLPRGFTIDAHSHVSSRPVEYQPGKSLPCRYRTGYPTTLWPVTVTAARLMPPPFPANFRPPPRTAAVLRLELDCPGELGFGGIELDTLRFYLSGDGQLIANLYEVLFNHVIQVTFRPGERNAPQEPLHFPPDQVIRPVGFGLDEGLLPYPNQSFLGYRLLTEFFTFPSKFLFLDLGGFRAVNGRGYRNKVEVLFYLNRTQTGLEQGVQADTFKLGCTPVINLFDRVAEPIPLTHQRYEYRITPDVAHPFGTEVYSVNAVLHTDPGRGTETYYQPFYSFRHGSNRDNQRAFWYCARQPSSQEGDRGTELYLHLVDLDFNPRLPAEAVIVARTTCTNRNVPSQLMHAGEDLYFELEQAAPLSRTRCVRTPTAPLRPPLRRGAHWRLLSHLTLNHLSLASDDDGRDALQEILRLYDFSDPEAGQGQLFAVNQHLIEGILSVKSRHVVGRTGGPTASGFARGTEVTVEFDEQKYVGTGAFLFACVLERFLGLYTSINSFTQLIGTTKQGEGYFKKWPPRAGEHQLL